MLLTSPVYATTSSPWTQTDWSGGSGQTNVSDATKFSSSSNINSSVSGQLTLSSSSNWYNTSWLYRRKITFDNSAQAENLTNFPVLVKLNSSRINYSNTQNSGQDIRFTDSDGTTLLSYEIEKWDESGDSFVWVKIPQIDASSSTDNIYVYYGNSSASDGQSATNVWSSEFKGMWHLAETGNGTANEYNDSTSNNYDGRGGNGTVSAVPVLTPSAQINGGQVFDGTNDFIKLPTALTIQQPLTMQIWVKPEITHTGMIVSSDRFVGAGLYYSTDNKFYFVVRTLTNGYAATSSTHTFAAGSWYLLSWVYNGSVLKGYVNGVEEVSIARSGTIDYKNGGTSNEYAIGCYYNVSSCSTFFKGSMDNLSIENAARSASWVTAYYKSTNDAFNTHASEEQYSQTSGTLNSSIFDTQHDISANWGTLTYTATTPTNTSTSVKVRTSSSPTMDEAPDFATCSTISSGSSIGSNSCVSSSHRYIQYQVTLANTDSVSTPTFEDISISFTNPPTQFSLDNPSHNAYTKGERPTFSWKSSSDISGLSSYTVEIDNGDVGDFTIPDIPIIRNEDYDVTRYKARYENFKDDNQTNNTIFVSTKSSKDWGDNANDGILKEGKRTWVVKARDTNGNERVLTRAVLVDRTAPSIGSITVNGIASRPLGDRNDGVSTTDTTPTIYGTITDPLAGDKTENKVASGPKKIDVQIEQKTNSGIYQKYRTETVALSDLYFSSTNKKITDNSQKFNDKYASVIYTPSQSLPYGTYKVTLTATDIAGNSTSSTPFTLSVTTLSQITTPQEKQIIKEETQSLKPEVQKQVMQELEITKPQNQVPTSMPQPVSPAPLDQSISTDSTGNSFFGSIGSFFSNLFK